MKNLIKTIKEDKLLLGLSIALLVVLGISLSLILFKLSQALFASNRQVEIIDFTNLTEEEIEEWYFKEFENTDKLVIQTEYSEDLEIGKVISQQPKAQEKINKDTEVKVTLSKGKNPDKTFNLPDFVKDKYTKDEIEKYFNENGFTDVTYEYKVSDKDVAKDIVISLNRTGSVKRSDMILVTLSAGDEEGLIEVVVPNLLKYSINDIKTWANNNMIVAKFEYVFSSSTPQGQIISQSIKEGETIKGGSSITIKVSNGNGITIADLSGKTVDQIKKYANDNGLKLEVEFVYSDKVKEGLAVYSVPKAKETIAVGGTLKVAISSGKNPEGETVEIKDCKGMTEKEFLAYVNGLGVDGWKEEGRYSDLKEGLVVYNTTGKVKVKDGVQYALSLGKYKIDLDEFEGVSLKVGKSIVERANAKGANIKLDIKLTETNDYDENTLFDCRLSNEKLVTCKLAVNDGQTEPEQKPDSGDQEQGQGDNKPSESGDGYIHSNFSYYNGDTLEQAKQNVMDQLGKFDLVIRTEESDKRAGVIISIKVNGKSYKSGRYSYDSHVEVIISSGYKN